MKPRAYIETSVISYLTAKPSRDVIVVAHQQLTREWWEGHRQRFELCSSQILVEEASAGDPEAAQKRLAASAELPVLDLTRDVADLANELVNGGVIPPKHIRDAFHIAAAAVHGMDYLVTWNCTHIANAELRQSVEAACRERGYRLPIICTPEELMGV